VNARTSQFQAFNVDDWACGKLKIPKALVAAWFPGTPLPFDVSLQLEVDGQPWGPRFASRVDASRCLRQGLRFPELDGCRMTAFRRAAGPAAALDVLMSSLKTGGAGVPKRRATTRALDALDLEEDAWPVVRHWF
jgi:hypothetical protein